MSIAIKDKTSFKIEMTTSFLKCCEQQIVGNYLKDIVGPLIKKNFGSFDSNFEQIGEIFCFRVVVTLDSNTNSEESVKKIVVDIYNQCKKVTGYGVCSLRDFKS